MPPTGHSNELANRDEIRGEWILVVEDDPALLQLMERALRAHGHVARGVRDGAAAIEAMVPLLPRLMVLDYSLPDMDGEQLLEQMREQGCQVPFVVATGHGSESVAVDMMKCGAYDYLVKGAGFLQLLPVVVDQAVARAREAECLARAEEELRVAHEELEQRVELRTAELAEANRRLRAEMEERQRAEELVLQHQAELAHVARLTTVGEMMAELTHELTQPLSAVCSFAQACQRLLQADEATRQAELPAALQQIVEQGTRAVEIIRRMRRFTIKTPPSRVSLDVNAMIREVAALMGGDARLAKSEIHFELTEPMPAVLGDRIQLEQVLVNLIRNGLEALRDCHDRSGRLTVRTGMDQPRWVSIDVQDNGVGMSADIVERLFDRFFTTKAEGMGLGLPISRAIVENHGGRLELVPHCGDGTTFRITLPSHLGV